MIYVLVDAKSGAQIPITKTGVVYHDYNIAMHWERGTYWGLGKTKSEALAYARQYVKHKDIFE